MKMSIRHIILFSLTAIVTSACGGGKSGDAAGETTRQTAVAALPGQLPLPVVPETITDSRERAAYVVEHFWDAMDFSDTLRSHNRDFVEQNFANYASIFSLVDREELLRDVTHLLISAEKDSQAFKLLTDVAEKYLYEPNSPMLNEEEYELFLPAIISSRVLDNASKERYLFQQESINKNRCGSIAADFSYSDVTGKLHTLWTTDAASRLLLLFFDPECDHCKEVLAGMEASSELKGMVDSGNLSVMAICAVGDRSQWAEVKNSFPSNWIVGLDRSDIDDKRIYVLRAMPSIYLLDEEKRVVLKDVRVDTAMDFLRGECRGRTAQL
jgi:hypothetical protein